jgi:Flp pilus assembly protein TadG
MFAILLPALLSVSGLVIDVGTLLREYGRLELVADAAATAAARDLLDGKTVSEATTTANNSVAANSGGTSTDVTINIPPASGPHTGDNNYVEVLLSRTLDTYLIDFGAAHSTVTARAVAGHEEVTGNAAVVVLSDRPVSYQGYYNWGEGGLTVLGSGTVDITGDILVNDGSGQFDENGNLAGKGPGLPYGISAQIPLYLPRARVVGGVDDPSNFNGTISGVPPLSANRRPVNDPLASLPVPTVNEDGSHVIPSQRGSFELVNSATYTELQPGVYEWIRVIDSNVKFTHGVYIIRNVNPSTNIGLEIQGSQVNVDSVMFYITDNTGFSANSGLPDAYDTVETAPSTPWKTTPSVDIRISGDSRLKGLDHAGTPYHGMLIFQRRWDRRWIRIDYQNGYVNRIWGTVYAPVAKLSLYSAHDVQCEFAVGSLRLYNYGGLDVNPPFPFPPVRDVFLVE